MLALLSRRLVKKRETHNEKQQALNNMFAKLPKSEGNNTTKAGIMDVQILVKPLPMTQRERENNKHSYETFQKYIQHSKEGKNTHTNTRQDQQFVSHAKHCVLGSFAKYNKLFEEDPDLRQVWKGVDPTAGNLRPFTG